MELKIFLLILRQKPAWGTSFDLHRVSNRMFGLYNSNDYIRELLRLDFISQEYMGNGNNKYTITHAGRAFLMEGYEAFTSSLLVAFPDKVEFIIALLRR